MRSAIFFLCGFFLMLSAKAFASTPPSVVINEFLPNPVGDDTTTEWIELFNASSTNVSLDGWILSDVYGTTKNFSLTGKSIPAGGYLVLYRVETQITLNNDTEQVKLIDPSGNILLSAIVSNPVEGKSYALVGGSWVVSDPTPGAANVVPTPSPSPTLSPSPLPSPSSSLPTPSPPPTLLQSLQITEVVACGSSTEWVELFNPNESQIFLDGWKIQDSSTQAKLLDSLAIPAHGFLVKEWAGYLLNNDGDEVRLFEGDELADSFTYNSCTAGYSWAKIGTNWEQTQTITKGTENPATTTQLNSSDREKVLLLPPSTSTPGSTPPKLTLSPQATQPTLPQPQLPSLLERKTLGVSTPSAEVETMVPPKVGDLIQHKNTSQIPPPSPPFLWWYCCATWFFTAGFMLIGNATMSGYAAHAQ